MKLQYITRGMSDARGKPRVFLACHPEDRERAIPLIAEDLLRHVIDLRAELGVEDRLADLGSIDASAFEEHVGDMAEAALGDRCTPTNPRPVSRQDLVNLYRDAYNG